MRNIEIPLPANARSLEVERAVEQSIADAGLVVRLKGTLKRFPGCVHWHVRRQRDAGTLEITLCPNEHRAWFTVQDGRRADWIEEALSQLSQLLQNHIRSD